MGIENVRQFAIDYHKDQMYGLDPYVKHLDHVYEVSKRFNLSEEIQIASYLHDLLEDTDCKFEDIWSEFGWYVTHLVFLVTDEPGSNRKERMMYIDEYPLFKSELYIINNIDIKRMFEYLEPLNF